MSPSGRRAGLTPDHGPLLAYVAASGGTVHVKQVKVDIRIPVGRPIPELADWLARCEDAGFHGVGVHDHHHAGRDAYLTLAVGATRTSSLTLYPAVSNSVTRDPLVLAALANSVAELAPGRTMVSLAPGFLSVERAGRPRASVDQLRSAFTSMRDLLAGATVPLGDTATRLRQVASPVPPALLLASGPRLLELAGEIADGVLMLVGLDPAAIAAARRHLRTGAERAGRDPAGLKEIFIVPIGVGDQAEVRAWPRSWFRPGVPWLAYPSRSNLRWLRAAGIELADDLAPDEVSDALADRVCDAFGLFGPAEHCAERLLRAREEAGVEHVFLFPVHTAETGYDMPEREIEAFARTIGPMLSQRC
ncbi:MAG: LLM class flavin-dependent oxidoreductase [Streptosporangiales bacterium]|nr:LLM class flavin-dependent oxidoreductase [Streptosporangiales bacterium]